MKEKNKYNDGVYDISNEEYHASSGFSRSQLMLMNKSPYHFWFEILSGRAEKKEETPAMIIGSLFHTLLLEPEKFDNEYAICPKVDKRTTKGKEDWESFSIFNQGKKIITQEQFDTAFKMASQIKEHEIVQTLLDESVFEQSIYWTDIETGLQFKTRPDIWSNKMVVDLKTTNDASFFSFSRSALNYGYYLQAGMCFEACKAISKPFEMFVILACEKQEPYVPSVFMMKESAIDFGINQFNYLKKKLIECIETNKWPAYPIFELDVPKYALLNNEE